MLCQLPRVPAGSSFSDAAGDVIKVRWAKVSRHDVVSKATKAEAGPTVSYRNAISCLLKVAGEGRGGQWERTSMTWPQSASCSLFLADRTGQVCASNQNPGPSSTFVCPILGYGRLSHHHHNHPAVVSSSIPLVGLSISEEEDLVLLLSPSLEGVRWRGIVGWAFEPPRPFKLVTGPKHPCEFVYRRIRVLRR